jgi:hypothetical protein
MKYLRTWEMSQGTRRVIDKALLTLRNQPLGEFLVMLAALGLAVFGIYGLCEARWRKV